MKQHEVRRRGARRSTPAQVDYRTDALERTWRSLPEVEESLGLRVRVEQIDLRGIGGTVLA